MSGSESKKPDARWPFRILAAILGAALFIPVILSALDGQYFAHLDFFFSGLFALILAVFGKWIG
jgi:hypothetical protein